MFEVLFIETLLLEHFGHPIFLLRWLSGDIRNSPCSGQITIILDFALT